MKYGYYTGYGYIANVNGKIMCFATDAEYIDYVKEITNYEN